MINDLLKLKNQNNNSYYDRTDSKGQIMSTMTQEVFANYKKRISILEGENAKLDKDLRALTRNFEALSLKRLEEANLIKRLQNELSILQGKSKENSNDFKSEMIKNYQKQIEEIKRELEETQFKLKSQCKKNIEDVQRAKKQNDELKSKINNMMQSDSEMEKIKKNYNEVKEKVDIIEKENKEIKKELDKEKGIEKDLIKMNDLLVKEKEKLIKENKLMYGMLEETREKLKSEVIKNDDLRNELKAKPIPNEDTEKQLQIALDKITEIENELEISKQESNFNELNAKNLLQELTELKNKKKLFSITKTKYSTFTIKSTPKPKPKIKIKPLSIISLNSFSLLLPIKESKIISYKITNTQLTIIPIINITQAPPQQKDIITHEISFYYCASINKVYNAIVNIRNELEEKTTNAIEIYSKVNEDNIAMVNNTINRIENKVNIITNALNNNIANALSIAIKMKSEYKHLKQLSQFEIAQLKQNYDAKLTKKRNKKYTLKNEIKTLNDKITEMNKTKVDLTEINKLFNKATEITSRLKLSIESLEMSIHCSSCNSLINKIQIFPCGHSLCKNCISSSNPTQCIECSSTFPFNSTIENISLNKLIAKYNYAKLQINSDLDLVLSSIKSYLNH